MTADEAEKVLGFYKNRLGLDKQRVAAWRAQSDVVSSGGLGSRTRAFEGAQIGNTSVEIEAATVRGEDRVLLFVDLKWC